jgi:radical SAM/Cys-rich protein
MMSDETIEDVLRILRKDPDIRILDITGGAPELHPRFRHLVENARGLDKRVLVRHNLTVTMDPHPMTGESMDYLPEFFAQQGVEIVSSLPYYQEYFTDKQRGDGVFQKSIVSLQKLNKKGFGMPDTGLCLNLIYNPAGAFIPPPQEDLERQYKKSLKENFGIEFNQLFALTNMPIHRFKAQLKRLKSYEEYMEKLVSAFNPAAAEGIMCRSMVSVSYDGKIYDCDFNQMLDMPIMFGSNSATLKDWSKAALMNRTILTADHCFGCTAGAGSSCGGNTA